MATWAKWVFGLVAAFLILILLSLAWLFRSEKGAQLRGMAGGVFAMKREGEALERLEKEHPFKAPSDGLLQEARLLAYLEVCRVLTPRMPAFNRWMDEHAGKQGDLQDAQEAIGFFAVILRDLNRELVQRQMSFSEFAWIHRTLSHSRRTVEGRSGTAMASAVLRDLREVSKAPGVEGAKRAALERKIEEHQRAIQKATQARSPNEKLYLAHMGAIQEADLGELGDQILGRAIIRKERRPSPPEAP